jgi:predicted  nucleic acid-binding Zn-ribbon protein
VQLTRRLETLPARSQLAAAAQQLAAVDAQVAAVDARRSELRRTQQRLEDEIASLTERATQAEKRLYSGAVSNPRELQALQDDVASIRRRIGQLEDAELEIMEQSEPVDAEQAELETERHRLQVEHMRLAEDLTAAETEIATELEAVRSEREGAAASVPVELWAEYDRLRSRLDGVAVARLVGSICQGCHLQLSAVEIDRIRRLDVDEVVHCEACGRLLVRD